MNPADIMKQLEYYNWKKRKFPLEAIQAAVDDPDAIIPDLLKVLEHTANNADDVVKDETYMAHLYALYLLAQFREKRAYPLILKLMESSSSTLELLLSDTITEDLDRILASVYDGDLQALKALIENQEHDEWARVAAISSLVILVAQDALSREDVLTYFKSLLHTLDRNKEDYIFWSYLINHGVDLYPDMIYDEIKQAFADNIVDEMVLDLAFVDGYIERGKESVLAKLKTNKYTTYIDDTTAEMKGWAAFQPKSSSASMRLNSPASQLPYDSQMEMTTGQVIRTAPKIGRNDPCPCGSGKKYKKCCGRNLQSLSKA